MPMHRSIMYIMYIYIYISSPKKINRAGKYYRLPGYIVDKPFVLTAEHQRRNFFIASVTACIGMYETGSAGSGIYIT